MIRTRLTGLGLGLTLACGGSDGSTPPPSGTVSLQAVAGEHQVATVGTVLAPFQVLVHGIDDEPAANVAVQWSVQTGCGTVSASTSQTDAAGLASTTATLGQIVGVQTVQASVGDDAAAVVEFAATATATPAPSFQVLAGCNNVPERLTSDLWVADGYGYTGSWGAGFGAALNIWRLSPTGAPVRHDSINIRGVTTVSDVEVSPDGRWLVLSAEKSTHSGNDGGLHVYELTAPGNPVFRARTLEERGFHTGTLSVIDGKLYAFAAKNPPDCALKIYDLSTAATGTITLASNTPIPDQYCIHDTFVRDGLAFVFAWNEGLYIFDVGNGMEDGSPSAPKLISQTKGLGGETHNGWWFWNPTNGQKRYLFIGEEGPAVFGTSSSGSLHVVDVSDLTAPVEVASYTMAGAGVHNFWMDEARQVLYAAFYNGGIVALDVSGTLSGDLAGREIARVRPGGANRTYMWGVMLYDGYLYGSDLLSDFWQLAVP